MISKPEPPPRKRKPKPASGKGPPIDRRLQNKPIARAKARRLFLTR